MRIMKMKSLLQIAIILYGVSVGLGEGHAQPPISPRDAIANQNAPSLKLTDGNLKAAAAMGGFYNAILRASSYRGHLILSKTIVKEGKVMSKKVVDWQSTWLGDGDGGVKNDIAEVTITTIEGDGVVAKTTVEKVNTVEDGETKRIFDPLKNIWSEKKQLTKDSDMAIVISSLAWTMTLAYLALGNEFNVSNLVTATEPKQIVVANQTNDFKFTFDPAAGYLRLWSVRSNPGETIELQWNELELNQPLAPKVFEWVPPVGARQVPPADNEHRLDF